MQPAVPHDGGHRTRRRYRGQGGRSSLAVYGTRAGLDDQRAFVIAACAGTGGPGR